MPKDKKSHHQIHRKDREYACKPYCSHNGKGHSSSSSAEQNTWNGWDDITCPVCMETPHNAVLLRCTSHDKGCRPYMCDTSYRHSNCLDQYCKAHLASQKACPDENHQRQSSVLEPESQGMDSQNTENSQVPENSLKGREIVGLLCPLCRGRVLGWEVARIARDFLNKKSRVCSREGCSFTGPYEELRAHARRDHPTVRPSEVDPGRQRRFQRLERQQELGDVLSVIQSTMPRATLFGDYALEDEGDYIDSLRRDYPNDDGRLLTVLLLFQVLGPDHSYFSSGRSHPPLRGFLRRYHRSGTSSSRQGLWGEILQHNHNEDDYVQDGPEEHPRGASFQRPRRYHHRRSFS